MARRAARQTSSLDGPRDQHIVAGLLVWFDAAARDLPWRPPGRAGSREPYQTLVSEFMLQQTQASRVAERLPLFMNRFPTLAALARADEHDVLAEWSGLGYYRRARNLHAAARAIADLHTGRVPAEPDSLLELPGIGRYTAGAIASLAFNRAVPAVDGNVSRVILRLEGKDLPLASPETITFASARAAALLATPEGTAHAGALNESLIELGATVCTPKSPRCPACPVRSHCRASALGLQNKIPRPKPAARQKELLADCIVLRDAAGRFLVERRPDAGLWARMWQAPTLETAEVGRAPAPRHLPRLLQLSGVRLPAEPADDFTHATTHRLVRFRVWHARPTAAQPRTTSRAAAAHLAESSRAWKSADDIARLALSNPQRRILLGAESGRG